jgi:hypothetical protein
MVKARPVDQLQVAVDAALLGHLIQPVVGPSKSSHIPICQTLRRYINMQGLATLSAVKPLHAVSWSPLARLTSFESQWMQHY